MIESQYETDVHCAAETLFDVIVDLHGYDRWLAASHALLGITNISSDPVALGTTYIESGSRGVRHGTVTVFEPPTQVAFHQPMTMKPGFLGVIDIHVRYTMTPATALTHVCRVVWSTISWPLKLGQPLVVRQFRAEGERTLLALKAFAEDLS